MSFKNTYEKAIAANRAADSKWAYYADLERQRTLLNKECSKTQLEASNAAFEVGVEIGLFSSAADRMMVPASVRFALIKLLESGRLTFNEDIPR